MNIGKQLDYRLTVVVPDCGYTALCPSCNRRYNQKQIVIGRPRALSIERCDRCPKFKTMLPTRPS